jgi:hypothetical protein
MTMFSLDKQDLKKLEAELKKSKGKKMNRLSAFYVNELAFNTSFMAQRELRSSQTIRNASLLRAKTRVRPTKVNIPWRRQKAIVGSLRDNRFGGWAAQERFPEKRRKRTFTKAARPNPSRAIPVRHRAMAGKSFPVVSDAKGINELVEEKHKGLFVITGHKQVPRGIYKFSGRQKVKRLTGGRKWVRKQIERVQIFKPPKRTRRNPWLQRAESRVMVRSNQQMAFASAAKKAFKDML